MTDAALMEAEESVAEMIGARFSGAAEEATEERESVAERFQFDEGFQTVVAAFALRDNNFMRSVGHLLKPDYFENAGEAAVVNLALKYWQDYGTAVGSKAVGTSLLKGAKASGAIRGDELQEVGKALLGLFREELVGGHYVAQQVAEFARHQAVSQAILKSVDMLDKKKFDKIEKAIKDAIGVGINEDGDEYDYFEKIAQRTAERIDRAAGKLPPTGITTGFPKLDDLLYHKGWGRRELTVIMGGAKAGKSTALIGFAKAASLAGKNVLYVTLEVAAKIISERLDASLTDTLMSELGIKIHEIQERVEKYRKTSGELRIHEYPSGAFTPGMLRRLLDRYKAKGITFDLIAVDYADIMAPDHRTTDSIENSKNVMLGLRAIAFEENVAMLTATQTNREGYKSIVAKAEHIAEDFNKVRIADLLISINATEEERRDGDARLYFAASRNQAGGFTVYIKQDLERMKFLISVVRVE